jgi:hypothetical protein
MMTAVMDVPVSASATSTTGYITVANPNDITCAAEKYEIKLGDSTPSTTPSNLSASDISFATPLNTLEPETNYLLKKTLFLKPGESVKLPIKINLTSANLNSLLRIYAFGIEPFKNFTFIDLAWTDIYSGYVNLFTLPMTVADHPHKPQDLNAYHVTGQQSALVPNCSVETFINGKYLAVSNVDLQESLPLKLRITKKYATKIEYNCNNTSWNEITVDSNNEVIISGLRDDLSCRLRASRLEGGKTINSDCAPIAKLDINIVKTDKAECVIQPGSNFANYSMTASLRISDSNIGKTGFKYIVAKTKDGQWYSYSQKNWIVGQRPFSSDPTPLSDLLSFLLFEHMNLTDFIGTTVYLGYGIGNDETSALREMTSTNRLHECVRL